MPKHMKGLQNFLAELRKCKTTIEETSRINREIDHIKSRFEGKGSINGYQRRKYVCKLVYIALIGFDIETLGCNEAIELISSTKFSEKQMGYLFLSLTDKYLTVQSQLLQLLHHDLTSNNALANELATSYLANAGDLNLGKATAKEVLSLALDGKRTAVVRTKAILCLEHAYKLGAFQVDGESAYGLVRLLHDPHPSVVRCAVSLHSALLCETVFRVVCQKAAPDYAKFLVKVGMSANLDEYAYRNIPDPWLQLDLLRVLRVLEPLQSLSSERTEMIAYFRTFFERAAQDPVRVAKGTSSMFNIRESVLTDIVRVLMLYPDEQDTIRQCVSLLGEMLCTRMLNVRLIVLELFLQVIKLDFCLPLVKKFDDEIRKTLQAKDDTLRIVTAELVVELSVNDDQASRKAIATEMLGFIETVDPPERRHVLAAKLAEMASTIKADAKWHMKSMMRAFDNSGDRTVSEKLVKGVMQTIVDNESLHSDAARLCFSCMRGGQGGEPMLRLCCLVLPVFGHHVVRAGTASPEVIFTTMSGRVQNLGTNASEHTLSAYIASCTKFVSHFPAIKGLVDDAVVNSTALAEYEKQMYQSLASTMPNREQVSQQQREEQQIRQAERREQEAQQAAVAAHATRAAEPAAPEPELRQTEPEPAVTQEEPSREETPTQAPLPYENAPATAAQHSSDSINRQNVPSSGGLYDDE